MRRRLQRKTHVLISLKLFPAKFSRELCWFGIEKRPFWDCLQTGPNESEMSNRLKGRRESFECSLGMLTNSPSVRNGLLQLKKLFMTCFWVKEVGRGSIWLGFSTFDLILNLGRKEKKGVILPVLGGFLAEAISRIRDGKFGLWEFEWVELGLGVEVKFDWLIFGL